MRNSKPAALARSWASLTPDQRRARIAERAAGHRTNTEGRDHDQPGPSGFYDSAGTYRTKRRGQRGRF